MVEHPGMPMAPPRDPPVRRDRPTIRQLGEALLRPGPPPAGWPRLAILVVGGTVVAVAALGIRGEALRGDPDAAFAEGGPGTWLSAFFLVAAAVLCVRAAWNGRGPQRAPVFWILAAAMFLLMAADEQWMLHERVDRRIHRIFGADPTHPITDHLDDLIVASYGVLAAAAIWYRRGLFVAFPWMLRCGVAVAVCFGFMVVLDLLDRGWDVAEEGLKLIAGSLLIAGLLAVQRTPASSHSPPGSRSPHAHERGSDRPARDRRARATRYAESSSG